MFVELVERKFEVVLVRLRVVAVFEELLEVVVFELQFQARAPFPDKVPKSPALPLFFQSEPFSGEGLVVGVSEA